MEGIVSLVVIVFLAALAIFLYFIPTLVAYNRQHHQRVPILVLNFFFGWTMLGWVGALVWSLTHISREIRSEQSI